MKKRLICVSASVLLGLTACGSKVVVQPIAGAAAQKTAEQTADAQPAKDGGMVTYTGSIKPAAEIQMLPKISGTVTKVNADIGSVVKAGDVLCVLDDTDIKLQVSQAQSNYNAALVNLKKVQEGTSVQTVTQLKQAVDKATIDLGTAEANYDRAKSAYDAHTQVKQAALALEDAANTYTAANHLLEDDTTLTAAQNAYNDAQAGYDRAKSLFAGGVATQKNLDDAESLAKNTEAALHAVKVNSRQAVDSAKVKMDTAQQTLNNVTINEKTDLNNTDSALKNASLALKTAKDNLNLTTSVLNPENIQTAQASVDSAKASLDLADRQLQNTSITAPINGSVSAKPVQEGMLVSPQTPLFSVVNLDSVNIEIKVNQDDVNAMTVGKEVSISIKNTDVKDLKGNITAVSPSADLQTGLFSVKITINNSEHNLKGGLFADVTIAKNQQN